MKKTLVAPSALVNNNDIIQPAVIEINNDIITKISNHIPKKTDNLIKLDDTVLLPGLTNAHAHLELTGIGPLKEHGFVSWIKELIKAKTRQTPTDVVDSLHKGSQLLLSSGVTTTIDHISFDSPIAAYKKLSGTFIGFGEVVGSIEPISRMIYERLQDLQRASPIELNLTLHAIQTVNENIIREFLKNDEPPFSVHLCEYGEEQEYFQNNTGPFYDYVVERFPELKGLNRHQAPSAIQYLDKHNEALHHSLIIHANYIDAADIAILNKWQNICVVHCPGSFAFFQHDQFPFEQYKINNIKIFLYYN